MGMRRGTISILNPETSQLQIEVAQGLTAEARKRGRYKLGEGITGRVVETGEPAVVPVVSQEPLFLNRTRSRGTREKDEISFICVPVKINHQTIGALSVDRLHRELDLDHDLRLLTIIASIIAQTVNNLLLIDREKERLQNENLKLKGQLQERYQMGNIIGTSGRMRQVFEMIGRVAKSNATILIRGESGTGKEMVASAVHYNSLRADKPFIKVNVAALPETLVESELFGHERALSPGPCSASRAASSWPRAAPLPGRNRRPEPQRPAQAAAGHPGTGVYPPGGTTTLKADVRLLAATHRDLEQALTNAAFREDLYYRLNVFPIYLPPLRERMADIPLLADHFLGKYAAEHQKPVKRLSAPALDLLMQYPWPGNVRELENIIERAVLVCDEDTILSVHLPASLQRQEPGASATSGLASQVEKLEKELITEALRQTRGNQSKAAHLLDTSLRILGYKIKQYAIETRSFRAA